MTQFYISVIWMDGTLEEVDKSEYYKEFDKARHEIYKRMGLSVGMIGYELKFMLYKGIKYIPAIVYTAWKLERSYERPMYCKSFEGIISMTEELSRVLIGAYRKLRKKVKGARTLKKWRHLRIEEAWCELDTPRVAWPPETLDVEEVQEEIKRLAEDGDLLSKDKPEDREFAKRHIMATEHLYYRMEGEVVEPLDIRIDSLIEHVNRASRAWGEYFKAIRNIHHKYPNVKFYICAIYA